MKHTNFLKGVALAFVASLGLGTAQAASIEGSLNFGGEAVPIPGPGLADATGLSFTSGFLVSSATGTFESAGLGFGDAGTIADFFFLPLMPSPVNPMLQILFDTGDPGNEGDPGKFSFSLESIEIVDQTDAFLVLAGCGTLSGTGLDATEYAISLSLNGVGALYAFSGTLAPKVVPVPGALILMVSALAMLGIRRRD